MRCPKCKSEVGSQKNCPYCGSPMYIPNTKPTQNAEATVWNRILKMFRSMDSRVAETEKKLQIMIVLESGILILLLLILAAILIK